MKPKRWRRWRSRAPKRRAWIDRMLAAGVQANAQAFHDLIFQPSLFNCGDEPTYDES